MTNSVRPLEHDRVLLSFTTGVPKLNATLFKWPIFVQMPICWCSSHLTSAVSEFSLEWQASSTVAPLWQWQHPKASEMMTMQLVLCFVDVIFSILLQRVTIVALCQCPFSLPPFSVLVGDHVFCYDWKCCPFQDFTDVSITACTSCSICSCWICTFVTRKCAAEFWSVISAQALQLSYCVCD